MEFVEEYFQQSSDGVLYVLCPFITTKRIEQLLQTQEEVVIVTSWRKDHLLAGVSDLTLFELVKKHPKWSLRINDRLHAKVFSHSLKDMIYGSANLTGKALKDGKDSNLEVMNYSQCSQEDEEHILQIVNQSLLITEKEYRKYLLWYDQNKDKYKLPPQESVIEPVFLEKEFLISSLPGSISVKRIWEIMAEHQEWDESWNEKSAAQHDLQTFELDCSDFDTFEQFLGEMRLRVSSHSFVDSFCRQIDGNGLYFGSAKQWIQETCIDDPVPYRKEITGYAQSLYSWLVELYPERYVIEIPNHSQCIKLRE